MNIEVRTANNMREVKRAYDFSASIFGTDYRESLERKNHTLRHDKVNNLWEVIVAADKDKIIGTLRIVERKNFFLGRLLKTAGITNVCVAPLYRGKGLGRDIVNKSIEVIRENRYPLSIVVARRAVDGFYSKYGFVGTGVFCDQVIPGSEFTKVMHKNISNFRNGYDEKLSERYLAMYRATYAGVPMSFYRSQDWWEDFNQKMKYKIKKDDFVNVINKGSLTGYFILHDKKIVEAACYSEKYADFCTAVMQFGRQHNFSEIIFSLSAMHPCLKHCCRNFNHTLSARKVFDGGHMIRIVDSAKVEGIILQFIDKNCQEFSVSQRAMAKKKIAGIFKKHKPQKHDEAADIVMSLSVKARNPVLEKVKNNILHTWGILDEF
jgi:predicted acetyltransferase